MTPRGYTPSCELTGVTLAYGDVTAVADLSLRVAPGETVALVGPSGAGKTSLLRMLAGMLPASSGTVCLQGQPVDGLSRDLPRLVGMMQQRLELVGELAVKHNVQAGALGRWGVLRSLAALLLPLEYPPARAAAERVGLTDKFGVRGPGPGGDAGRRAGRGAGPRLGRGSRRAVVRPGPGRRPDPGRQPAHPRAGASPLRSPGGAAGGPTDLRPAQRSGRCRRSRRVVRARLACARGLLAIR
ncbi:MAG: hypothetical protein BRC31_00835 [Actinobacteria bacterium QS_5_72_10]|nr:MAG: hypothetical protein BRC31_00835 [Actinobacteria bacterium QS_5_72_10]